MLPNTIQYQIDFWDSFAKESLKFPGAFAFVTGLQTPLLNLLVLEQQNLDTLQLVLPRVESFFGEHNVPWGVNIIDGRSSKEIICFLKNNDFKNICAQFQMQTRLDALTNNFVDQHNIKQVTDSDMLLDWMIPVANAFEATASDSIMYRELVANAFNKEKNTFEHFVLYINNKPVSSATLTITNEVARLDNVATVKKLQNQGFGKQIIAFSVERARNAGAKHIFFESSEAGIHLYKKMGFIEINTSSIYSMSKIL
ncbi:MAG: GNAT family N-acetyltransferase [Rickettsiaceae bacterium]|nr:GNAT family N-acetyltransferase [Rickettsiaceae bacterium]MDP4832571.1 GNAT family N-acetyltransferase [Rickettsiaceae bacterium]MDP5020187.1 GNAT family N-acetyltransferase [Rickettsiaceae bacterium]MDP5082917.1 GNAT family N-acetyltransferase [Rickettsiaceae bacterium]